MFVGTRLAMVSLLTSVGIRYYGFSSVELSFILNWLLLWFCECVLEDNTTETSKSA